MYIAISGGHRFLSTLETLSLSLLERVELDYYYYTTIQLDSSSVNLRATVAFPYGTCKSYKYPSRVIKFVIERSNPEFCSVMPSSDMN